MSVSLNITSKELETLLDAIAAYRPVRMEDKDWMRVPVHERLSPSLLDDLAGYLATKVQTQKEPTYPYLGDKP